MATARSRHRGGGGGGIQGKEVDLAKLQLVKEKLEKRQQEENMTAGVLLGGQGAPAGVWVHGQGQPGEPSLEQ